MAHKAQINITKGSAERVNQIRQRLKLSQSEFGRLLGVATNTVARWERGDLNPPKVAEMAAEYLLLLKTKHETAYLALLMDAARKDKKQQ